MKKKTLSQRFGECVRDLREETGLSQVEFGERCGFYQTYLSRIENGRANPTLNAMEVLANAFGLTVFELFEKVRAYPLPRTSAPPPVQSAGSRSRSASHPRQRTG